MADLRRIDVGFKGGGPALSVRISNDDYAALEKALADDKSNRWHTLTADESTLLIDLSQVIYVRHESGNQKVGF